MNREAFLPQLCTYEKTLKGTLDFDPDLEIEFDVPAQSMSSNRQNMTLTRSLVESFVEEMSII